MRYPWHPLFGREVQVRLGERYPGAVRVAEAGGRWILIPTWMLDEAHCGCMRVERVPRVDAAALVELAQLVADVTVGLDLAPVTGGDPRHEEATRTTSTQDRTKADGADVDELSSGMPRGSASNSRSDVASAGRGSGGNGGAR